MPDRSDVIKRIMPNKCDLCGIGVGVSMLYFENSWRPFTHTESKIHFYLWAGGRMRVCDECVEYLDSLEFPDVFLKKFYKNKQREDTVYIV